MKVRDVWGDPSGRSGTGRGTLKEVGGNSGIFGTGRGTIWGVQNRSGDTQGGPGRVEEPSEWSGTDRVILGEVRNGSGDHP